HRADLACKLWALPHCPFKAQQYLFLGIAPRASEQQGTENLQIFDNALRCVGVGFAEDFEPEQLNVNIGRFHQFSDAVGRMLPCVVMAVSKVREDRITLQLLFYPPDFEGAEAAQNVRSVPDISFRRLRVEPLKVRNYHAAQLLYLGKRLLTGL